MSSSTRRALVAGILTSLALALAVAVPGLPAAASAPAAAPSLVRAADPDTFTVEKTGGMTQLSDTADVEDAGRVLYDSRNEAGAFKAGESRVLDMFDGTPVTAPADVTAAILNVTAVSPTSSGWITIWPSDRSRPATSTLNFVPGTPTPNLAIVQLTSSRDLKVMNGSGGTTHVLVSLRGWVRSNGGIRRPGSFTATDATRVLDTRQSGAAVPARGYRDVTVAGVGAPTGASAAALSLIAVKPSQSGYLIAHPSDAARPTSTALTYRVGAARAALSVMRLSSTGTVRVWNMSSAPVHLVVDSFGWVAPGDSTSTPAGIQAIAPVRTLDTRLTTGALVPASPHVQVPVPGDDLNQYEGRPSGVVLAITATGATAAGFLRFDVADLTSDPLASLRTPSIVNFGRGETVTNTTYVTVPSNGRLWLSAYTKGQVHAVVDVVGIVRPRIQLDGRLVTEDSGAPLHPSEVTNGLGLIRVAGTNPDGTYRTTLNSHGAVTRLCGRAMTSSGQDLRYAQACLGGNVAPTSIPLAVGTRIRAGDILLPRAGTLAGAVTLPEGSTMTFGGVVRVRRTDGKFTSSTSFGSSGTWRMDGLPVGDWVVSVVDSRFELIGETIDEIPAATTPGPTELGALLAAGADTFTITAGGTTVVDDAQLKSPGALRWTVTDPDGDYTNVQYSIRHESGYVVYSGTGSTGVGARLLRPGGYTFCATEGAVTRCNGDTTSADEAPLLELVSGTEPVTATTITLP